MAWKNMLIYAWLVVAAVGVVTEKQEGEDVHIGSPQVFPNPITGTKIAQGAKMMQPIAHNLAGVSRYDTVLEGLFTACLLFGFMHNALNVGTRSVTSQNQGQHLQGDKSEGHHITAVTTEFHKTGVEGQDHASATLKHREKMGHHMAAVKAHRDMSQQTLDERGAKKAAEGPRADDLRKVAQSLAASTRHPKSTATDVTMGHHAAAMKAHRDMSQRKLDRTANGPRADDLRKVAQSLAASTGSQKSAATDESMGHHAAAMKAYRDMSQKTLERREAERTAEGPRADDLKKVAQSLATSTVSQNSAATHETIDHHAAAMKAYRDMSQKTLERREAKITSEGPRADDIKKVAQSLATSTASQKNAATDQPPMRGKHAPTQAALKEAHNEIRTQFAEKSVDRWRKPAHESQTHEALHDAVRKFSRSGSDTDLEGEDEH